MGALYRWLRQQPMTDGIAFTIIFIAAAAVWAVAIFLGFSQ